jgi:hypothetical protein
LTKHDEPCRVSLVAGHPFHVPVPTWVILWAESYEMTLSFGVEAAHSLEKIRWLCAPRELKRYFAVVLVPALGDAVATV